MKFDFHKLFLFGFFCISPIIRAGVIPEGFSVDRYSSLWQHSPFTIASVQQVVVQENFASKLTLVGVAKIGSEDVATLVNKDSQERITVNATPNKQDFKLVSVEQDADPLKVIVTIQKGGEVGKVKFDQALLAAPGAQSPPGNAVQQPGAPPNGAPPGPQSGQPPVLRVRRSLPIPAPYQPQTPH